jgi:hypothetical protein
MAERSPVIHSPVKPNRFTTRITVIASVQRVPRIVSFRAVLAGAPERRWT